MAGHRSHEHDVNIVGNDGSAREENFNADSLRRACTKIVEGYGRPDPLWNEKRSVLLHRPVITLSTLTQCCSSRVAQTTIQRVIPARNELRI